MIIIDFFNYKIPNRKKWLLTNEFLITFRNELDRIFEIKEDGYTPTYWNLYTYLTGTGGFCEALKIACERHNTSKAIYQYVYSLSWYDADLFEEELLVLMFQKGIIEEGDCE